MHSTTAPLSISQLIQRISIPLSEVIFSYIQTESKEVFAATMEVMCDILKYRPGIWKTWDRRRQREWLRTNLRQGRFNETGMQLLQEWFFAQRSGMMNKFLDTFGITHDKDGYVEGELPEDFEAAKLTGAVDALAKDYSGEEIALYLNLFQYGRPGGWEGIAKLLATDARLKI